MVLFIAFWTMILWTLIVINKLAIDRYLCWVQKVHCELNDLMSLTNFNLCFPDHSITSLNQSNNQSQFPSMPLHYIFNSYYYIVNLHINCATSNLLGPLFCQTGNIFSILQIPKRFNNFLNRTFSLTQIFLVNTYSITFTNIFVNKIQTSTIQQTAPGLHF